MQMEVAYVARCVCPGCGVEIAMTTEQELSWPRVINCPACQWEGLVSWPKSTDRVEKECYADV